MKGESVKDILQGIDSNSVFYIKNNAANNVIKEIKANDFMKFYSNNLDNIEYSS